MGTTTSCFTTIPKPRCCVSKKTSCGAWRISRPLKSPSFVICWATANPASSRADAPPTATSGSRPATCASRPFGAVCFSTAVLAANMPSGHSSLPSATLPGASTSTSSLMPPSPPRGPTSWMAAADRSSGSVRTCPVSNATSNRWADASACGTSTTTAPTTCFSATRTSTASPTAAAATCWSARSTSSPCSTGGPPTPRPRCWSGPAPNPSSISVGSIAAAPASRPTAGAASARVSSHGALAHARRQ